jgi:hypothetical protein
MEVFPSKRPDQTFDASERGCFSLRFILTLEKTISPTDRNNPTDMKQTEKRKNKRLPAFLFAVFFLHFALSVGLFLSVGVFNLLSRKLSGCSL